MRFFKKRPSGPAAGREPAAESDHQSQASPLLNEDAIRLRLENTAAAARRESSEFVVICLAPQLLPGQTLPEAELPMAMSVMEQHLRPADYVGRLGEERFLVVLPNTAEKPGHVVTHRMATELTVRSTRFNHRKWLGGLATFPSDAQVGHQLVDIAIANAKARPAAAA